MNLTCLLHWRDEAESALLVGLGAASDHSIYQIIYLINYSKCPTMLIIALCLITWGNKSIFFHQDWRKHATSYGKYGSSSTVLWYGEHWGSIRSPHGLALPHIGTNASLEYECPDSTNGQYCLAWVWISTTGQVASRELSSEVFTAEIHRNTPKSCILS